MIGYRARGGLGFGPTPPRQMMTLTRGSAPRLPVLHLRGGAGVTTRHLIDNVSVQIDTGQQLYGEEPPGIDHSTRSYLHVGDTGLAQHSMCVQAANSFAEDDEQGNWEGSRPGGNRTPGIYALIDFVYELYCTTWWVGHTGDHKSGNDDGNFLIEGEEKEKENANDADENANGAEKRNEEQSASDAEKRKKSRVRTML